MTFGENLKRLRKARGFSQRALADLLSISQQALALWEAGGTVPTADKLRPICKALEITLDQLIPEEITWPEYLAENQKKQRAAKAPKQEED